MILYKLLGRILNATDAETKEAVADFASSKDVATKADIAELKTEMAKLEARLTRRIHVAFAIHTGTIITAVGLMIKFL